MKAKEWFCPSREYHSHPAIGSSMMKVALESLPSYDAQFVSKTIQRQSTPDQIIGLATHTLVLEPDRFEAEYFVCPEGMNLSRKADSALHDRLLAENIGKQELRYPAHELAKTLASAVLANPVVQDVLPSAIIERAILAEDTRTGLAIKCRADIFVERPNHAKDLLLDIKTDEDASVTRWGSVSAYHPIAKWRYDLSLAHYADLIEQFTGKPCEPGLIVVGKDEPHVVRLESLDDWMECGLNWRRIALDMIAKGYETGNWNPDAWGEGFVIHRSQPTQWCWPQ